MVSSGLPNNEPSSGQTIILSRVMQSKVAEIVTNYTMTTLVILQRTQVYARGCTVTDKPMYHGCKVRMYLCPYHIKICQHPSKLLKSRLEACLRKAMKTPYVTNPQSYLPMSETTFMAHNSWQVNTDWLLPKSNYRENTRRTAEDEYR